MNRFAGLSQRLWAAWRVLCSPPGSLESRLAGLELDVRERDVQIARLRREFALESQQSEQAVADASVGGLEALAKRAAPLLAQLSTLQAMADAGREVRSGDVLKLAGKITALFVDCGLEPLGQPGEVCPFDPQNHQRLSGGDVREGDPVKVRFQGYRFREAVISKAMVSREGGTAEEGTPLTPTLSPEYRGEGAGEGTPTLSPEYRGEGERDQP